MSTFKDLPSEVHVEIFTFLSVKHLKNILAINKSINDQLTHSDLFWKLLINNYTKTKQSNELLEISKIKKQLKEAIQINVRKRSDLKKYIYECCEEKSRIASYRELYDNPSETPLLGSYSDQLEELEVSIQSLRVELLKLTVD